MDDVVLAKDDRKFDLQLRPKGLKEFIGHEQICQQLNVLINAAKGRGEPLGHLLFYGPPGLGKTTLANILAHEMGTHLVVSSGAVIEKAGDLAGLLTNLQEGDILFIDEIHRLHRSIEEYLYPAMEDFMLDLMIDSGANARSVQVSLQKFTLVGATTKMGNLSSPLRSRFHSSVRLDYYEEEALTQIIMRSAKLMQVEIDRPGAAKIAQVARGTPRTANNLLRWVRDFAQLYHASKIDVSVVEKATSMISIDHKGLEELDKKILQVIIEHHDGGPVGIKAIAASIGEDEDTLSEVYEPYLIMQGFIRRTPRGREATDLAYQHLGLERSL